jgi:formamidopyrimidine-DNA glycosylase
MPELPEVETVRRGLVPVMEGRRLARVIQRRPDLRWPLPHRFAERLTGRTVLSLGRRSKYLLAALDDGETLIVHLGMSGRMLVEEAALGDFVHAAGEHAKHDHIVFEIEGGGRVTFNDARRFGAMDLWPTAALEEHKLLATLGPEPLGNGFSGAYLAERFAGRTTTVKAALLDQRTVAGLGNIYVCEALHRAGISPKRRAGSIGKPRIEALAIAVRETLADAIAAGGSSLRDYRQADGELGYFQHAFRVYGREGESCQRDGCRGMVRRVVQSARSSFYCPVCQR